MRFAPMALDIFDVKEYSQSNATAPLLPLFQGNVNVLRCRNSMKHPRKSAVKLKSALMEVCAARAKRTSLSRTFGLFAAAPDVAGRRFKLAPDKLYGRLAMPWTCFVVMLIAIPFGVATGQRSLLSVWQAAFHLFHFFVLQQVGLALARAGICLHGWRHGCRSGVRHDWIVVNRAC